MSDDTRNHDRRGCLAVMAVTIVLELIAAFWLARIWDL